MDNTQAQTPGRTSRRRKCDQRKREPRSFALQLKREDVIANVVDGTEPYVVLLREQRVCRDGVLGCTTRRSRKLECSLRASGEPRFRDATAILT